MPNYGERPMDYHRGLEWDAKHGIDVGFVPGMDYHKQQALRKEASEVKQKRRNRFWDSLRNGW